MSNFLGIGSTITIEHIGCDEPDRVATIVDVSIDMSCVLSDNYPVCIELDAGDRYWLNAAGFDLDNVIKVKLNA